MQFPLVVVNLWDWVIYRLSNVYAGFVLVLSIMIALYFSLPTISCEHRIFQYFWPRMGVFGLGVDPIDLVSSQTLFSYLAVCVVVHCLLTGIVMHIHAYCLRITLESGNIEQETGCGAKREKKKYSC